MKLKTIFLMSALMVSLAGFTQAKEIKVLTRSKTKYYYVYKAIAISEKKDTVLLLGPRISHDTFTEIKLEANRVYKIGTRFISKVKLDDDKYIFCSPGVVIIDNLKISNERSLPILILSAEEINAKRED